MNVVGSLFSGIGGLDHGLHRAGFTHAFFCESDEYRRSVLAARWPGVPIYDDVRGGDELGGGVDRPAVARGVSACPGASMSDDAHHRIQVPAQAVTAVRERIERNLGVVTSTRPEGHAWAIYFDAPSNVDLDFLRPDVLPPVEQA